MKNRIRNLTIILILIQFTTAVSFSQLEVFGNSITYMNDAKFYDSINEAPTNMTKSSQLLIKFHQNITDDNNRMHIVGVIRNQGNYTKNITITATTYDESSNIVTTISNQSDPKDLESYQRANFEIIIPPEDASPVRDYSIIAESEDYRSAIITSKHIPVLIMFKNEHQSELIRNVEGQVRYECRRQPALIADVHIDQIDDLSLNPEIEYITQDLPIKTTQQITPWGIERIGVLPVQAEGNDGSGINIAILDTGVDTDHPDLSYVFGFDFSDLLMDDADPEDFSGHGTHIAGIIAAQNNDIGVFGIAPGANVYILKVFTDGGEGRYSSAVEAIEWCIGTYNDAIEGNEIHIISMSWGSEVNLGDPGIEPWINQAYNLGIILVGSAGNEGNSTGTGDNIIYPARYENVIAVSAINQEDQRPSFSSTGPAVELAAPGSNIVSTFIDGYATLTGTSMSCAHVTGSIALLLNSDVPTNYDNNTNEKWDPAEIRNILRDTADDIGQEGKDQQFGYGLVNINQVFITIPEFYSLVITAFTALTLTLTLTRRRNR
ncbi:S8 family peptidase [[Eubacterium] cellulosolvens]